MAHDPDLEGAYALETPEDNLRLYRQWAETYDSEFVEATTYRFPALVVRTYLEAAGGQPCLDVGCGTGALAAHFPEGAVLDGLDLSPEMLAVAARKGRYRTLIEANLKEPLPLPDAAYAGLVSSGTFTHGHVGAEALPELVRVLAPGALAVITVRAEIWTGMGFAPTFDTLASDSLVTRPAITEANIYSDPARAPKGHGSDTGLLVTFRRL